MSGPIPATSLLSQPSAATVAAQPFRADDRWTSTATTASAPNQGDPVTLTWGFVADGTGISGGVGEPAANSTLRAFLDAQYGVVGGGADLTTRPWFAQFSTSFNRWSQLTGLTYAYEANDSGVQINGTTSAAQNGSLGVRADVRISGHSIDGQTGSNTLAYNYFPNGGDMVIDTDNASFFASTGSGPLGTRNVVMHEHGHGIGLSHVEPVNQTKLMEPFVSTAYEGPQFDDILAGQRNYGDALEKGAGNNTSGTATSLGTIPLGGSVSKGTSNTLNATSSRLASDTATDFISIDGVLDIDVFSFSVTPASIVTLKLTPKGPTYLEGVQDGTANNESSLNTAALSNLKLELLDTNGSTVISTASVNGAGGTELLSNILLVTGGTYFARVSEAAGAVDNIQMYQLDVTVPEPTMLGLAGVAACGLLRRRRPGRQGR